MIKFFNWVKNNYDNNYFAFVCLIALGLSFKLCCFLGICKEVDEK